MTQHLLKTPDERKQPSPSTSVSASTKGSCAPATAKPTAKPTGGSGSKGGKAAKKSSAGPKWAVTELLDVSDFDALVPRPAHRFPFTLDGFQKQAVARLEVSQAAASRQVHCSSRRRLQKDGFGGTWHTLFLSVLLDQTRAFVGNDDARVFIV